MIDVAQDETHAIGDKIRAVLRFTAVIKMVEPSYNSHSARRNHGRLGQ
jgi:hypothetical protein